MDYPRVISRNTNLLMQMVAALLVVAGLDKGAKVSVLPRHVRHAILSVLRPAEAALRRLLIIFARDLVVKASVLRSMPKGFTIAQTGGAMRAPVFCMFDQLKCFDYFHNGPEPAVEPRIWVLGGPDPVFSIRPAQSFDDMIKAGAVINRLRAIQHALDALPAQARRYARWNARSKQLRGVTQPYKARRITLLRSGLPPGHRQRHLHPVDAVLADCHHFALSVLNRRDTT